MRDIVLTDTLNNTKEFKDRVWGAIFGQAVGDALGHPIEFAKTHEVVGLEDNNKFTDDTQMFCAIGEALLESNPENGEEAFMETLTKHFVEWRKNPLGGSHRAPGGTCMEAVRKLGTGRHWKLTGATAVGKGNGSAMRAGIVGARFWKNPSYAFRIGCLTSVNTHNNLESILAAGMVAFLVASSIGGESWEQSVADGLELCAQFETRVPDYPTNAVPLNNTRDGQSPWRVIADFGRAFMMGMGNAEPDDFIKTIETDFTAAPAVAEAIYYNSHSDYIDGMLLESANHSDDSDTITAITGTIAGARWGFSDLPSEWTSKIELHGYLEQLAQRIWDASEEASQLAEVAEIAVEEAITGDEGLDLEEVEAGADDGDEIEVEF